MTAHDKNMRFALALLVLAILMLGPVGAAWAQVKVTSADPPSAVQGTEALDVAIGGSGFDNGSTVRFLVTGTENDSGFVSVTKVVYVGPKKLIATINVDAGATVGLFDIEVKTSGDRKGKGTTLFSVKASPVDPCIGATASFVLSKAANASSVKTLYLSNESGTCQRAFHAVSSGNYPRYQKFRLVNSGTGTEGRVVVSDGGDTVLLIRFPIGPDMRVDADAVRVDTIFDPGQEGFIDNGYWDLGADGRRLAYVTMGETGWVDNQTVVSRLRYIDDVDACLPPAVESGCPYGVGTLLDERVGLAERLANPRWSADGQQIYLEDRRGDSLNPYISRVSVSEPLLGAGEEPEIVIVGSMLSLFEIRQRGSEELIVFRERPGAGCDLVRIVASASCIGGSCSDQVNSTSPGVLVRRWATVQSITSDTIRILADGAKEGRKGSCTETGSIDLTVDSIVTGVQTTTLISGASGPSAK